MSDSNNVVDFARKRIVKSADPAMQEVMEFRAFYEPNLESVAYHVDYLLVRLLKEHQVDIDQVIAPQDYWLLVEAAMSLLMRAKGKDHPLMHPLADLFLEPIT